MPSRLLSSLLGATALTIPSLAVAQDAPDTVAEAAPATERYTTDEIVVTGSRIARDPNLVSPVPVQSLDEDAFRLTGDVSVADIVNDVPALVSSTAQEGSGSAGTGANALNLRGLGAQRTLTLVNGRRHVAGFEGSQAVDVGSIPVALIDRVEVLTGGASAVYGSDAVTGVVNFVLKRDFEGIDLDIGGGVSDEGDAERFVFRGVAGKNFLDDRLNVTLALDVVEDTDLRFGDRDWAANNRRFRDLPNPALRFQDGDLGGDTPNFSQFYDFDTTGRFRYGFTIPTAASFIDAYTAEFGAAPTLTAAELALIDRAANAPARVFGSMPTFSISSNAGVISPGDFGIASGVDVNGNGTADCLESFVGFNNSLVGTGSFGFAGGCWVATGDGEVRPYQDGLVSANFNQFGGDGIRDDFDEDFLYPETDNVVVNLLSNYEFLPGHTAFFEAKFSEATSTFGGPLNTFYDLLYGAPENPFLPDALQGLADETGGLYITRDPTDLGPNIDEIERRVWRVVAGVEGELSDTWRYELSLNEAEFQRRTTDNNFVLLDRFFAAIDVIEDANGNPICRSNVDPSLYETTIFGIPAFDPGYFTFTPGDGSCRPADIWSGPASISQEAVDFITTTVEDELSLRQTVYSAAAVGDTTGLFELPGGPIGLAVGAEYRREQSRNEVNPFDRGILPQSTSFTPGLPVSSVSGNGSLGFNAEAAVPNSRGSYDVVDVFGELSAPILRDAPFARELTLDAALRHAEYSTIGGADTWKVGLTWAPVEDISFRGTISQAIRAPNIDELFGPVSPATFRPVDPCDAAEIPNAPDPDLRQANCSADGLPVGFTDPLSARFLGATGGNADLEEETADTYTFGFVAEPRFAPGLAITVDHWNVEIEDAINSVSAQDIVNNCYDSTSFPNDFCGLFTRNDDPASAQFGGFNFLLQSVINFAAVEAQGTDFAVSYDREVGAHDFGIRIVGTHQEKLDFFTNPTNLDEVDPELGEIRRPEWAGNASLSWGFGDFGAVATLRYQSEQALAGAEIRSDDLSTGGLGFDGLRSRFGDLAVADETYILDLSARYDVRQNISVYGGIQNATDEEPFLTNEGWPVSARGRYFFGGVRLTM